MSIFRPFVLLLFCASLTVPASAEEWMLIGRTRYAQAVIEQASFRGNPELSSAWIEIAFRIPRPEYLSEGVDTILDASAFSLKGLTYDASIASIVFQNDLGTKTECAKATFKKRTNRWRFRESGRCVVRAKIEKDPIAGETLNVYLVIAATPSL